MFTSTCVLRRFSFVGIFAHLSLVAQGSEDLNDCTIGIRVTGNRVVESDDTITITFGDGNHGISKLVLNQNAWIWKKYDEASQSWTDEEESVLLASDNSLDWGTTQTNWYIDLTSQHFAGEWHVEGDWGPSLTPSRAWQSGNLVHDHVPEWKSVSAEYTSGATGPSDALTVTITDGQCYSDTFNKCDSEPSLETNKLLWEFSMILNGSQGKHCIHCDAAGDGLFVRNSQLVLVAGASTPSEIKFMPYFRKGKLYNIKVIYNPEVNTARATVAGLFVEGDVVDVKVMDTVGDITLTNAGFGCTNNNSDMFSGSISRFSVNGQFDEFSGLVQNERDAAYEVWDKRVADAFEEEQEACDWDYVTECRSSWNDPTWLEEYYPTFNTDQDCIEYMEKTCFWRRCLVGQGLMELSQRFTYPTPSALVDVLKSSAVDPYWDHGDKPTFDASSNKFSFGRIELNSTHVEFKSGRLLHDGTNGENASDVREVLMRGDGKNAAPFGTDCDASAPSPSPASS